MTCVMIEIGKKPDELYNAGLGFWLPPDTPYGNFQLKFFKIFQRLDDANRKIRDSFRSWQVIISSGDPITVGNACAEHVIANELAIYMMRRAADELVSLIWCLSECERTGTYPDAIEVDSLGSALEAVGTRKYLELFDPHLRLFEILNDISNALKHSFIDSDISLVGAKEPCVLALGLRRNRLSAGEQFHNVSLAALVQDYSAFYQACMQWLRDYSVRVEVNN
jgi:hypothetical protein